MPVNDPIASRYLNEMLRPAGDLLVRALTIIDAIQLDRKPMAKDLDTLYPAGGGVIEDNRASEGITPVEADHVRGLFKAFDAVIAMVDDDRDPATGAHTGITTRQLLHRFAVNPR